MNRSATPHTVRVRAPGKINLYLQAGALSEDGYHELTTVFQAVSLYEEVTATIADEISLSVTGSVDVSGVPIDERNLAFRAAMLLRETTGVTQGVHLSINKSVPVAGGMGGGSADAAAALVACDALWGTHMSQSDLSALGATLGADVPFSLLGGTAVGTGRGDVLSPVLVQGQFHWVLIINKQGLSTKDVYDKYDEILVKDAEKQAEHEKRYGRSPLPAHLRDQLSAGVADEVFHALRSGNSRELAIQLRNDLQRATFALRPDLRADLTQGLSERQGFGGLVSGSGPTLVFLCLSEDDAQRTQERFRARGYSTVCVRGPVPGARVISRS